MLLSDLPPMPSPRRFGTLFALIFAALAALGAVSGWATYAVLLWALAAGAFAVLAWRAPEKLAALNRAWFHFGLLLHNIVSPVVMGIMFFGILTPLALVLRALGRDELRLRPRVGSSSHWVERTNATLTPDSFKNQF